MRNVVQGVCESLDYVDVGGHFMTSQHLKEPIFGGMRIAQRILPILRSLVVLATIYCFLSCLLTPFSINVLYTEDFRLHKAVCTSSTSAG